MERSRHAELVDHAFTRQAASFNASAVANASEILERMVESSRPQRSERWLEAACGSGIVSRCFAAVAGSVHGVDVTPAMIDTARQEAASAGLDNVTFEVGEIERLRDPSHWASLTDSELRDLGDRAGLALTGEERFTFELDFDDWLERGTDSQGARDLVELSLADRPHGTECFKLSHGPGGRVLALEMWLGIWRR